MVVESDREGRGQVQEVVMTAVKDENGDPLGWFFLGVDAETPVERAFQESEQATGREARTGLVIGDQWFVRGIGSAAAAKFRETLGEAFWSEKIPRMVEVDGRLNLVIARHVGAGMPLGEAYQVGVFPLDMLATAAANLRSTAGWVAAAVAGVAALVAFLLARRLSQPLHELVAGTERVRQGDFGTDVEVRTRDEMGSLAKAFNAMTRDLALKQRYHEVLSKVSDSSVASQLMEGKLELGGKTSMAAVLFCDIRGFTAMTERLTPAEVVEALNRHMTAMTRVVHEHGGIVDKFVGDMVMAVFGAPVPCGREAERAARCALDMLAERKRLNAEGGLPVEVGIGIAFGEVVAGCMGSEDRLNYTVIGERVNLASRLCSAAKERQILIDVATAEAVAGELEVRPCEPLELRGYSSPVPAFALERQAEFAVGMSV